MIKRQTSDTLRLLYVMCVLCIFSVISAQTIGLIAWLLFIVSISVFQLYRKRLQIRKQDVIASTVLGSMVLFDNVFLGLITIPVCLASMTILHCSVEDSIAYYKTKAASSPMAVTLTCIFAGGGILAALNILLAVPSTPLQPAFHIFYLFSALQAGIFEEICFRLFLSACIIQLRRQERFTTVGNILVYGILILPHVLFHFPQSIDIGSILMLSLLFGLPFSIMMKKVNLVSAIGAHVMVDAVRFLMLGM